MTNPNKFFLARLAGGPLCAGVLTILVASAREPLLTLSFILRAILLAIPNFPKLLSKNLEHRPAESAGRAPDGRPSWSIEGWMEPVRVSKR
jgi:hypothetical protein